MAAFDGGLVQFLELTAWGYLALAFYVVFKGCLDGLLHRTIGAKALSQRARFGRLRRFSVFVLERPLSWLC